MSTDPDLNLVDTEGDMKSDDEIAEAVANLWFTIYADNRCRGVLALFYTVHKVSLKTKLIVNYLALYYKLCADVAMAGMLVPHN